jgi:hypothetical protein
MSAPAIHITDLFFHSEITRVAGSDIGDQWISERVAIEGRLNSWTLRSPSDSATPSPLNSSQPSPQYRANNYLGSASDAQSSDSTEKMPQLHTQYESECTSLSDIIIDEEMGDRLGLLYTDAAHTVLRHIRCRRHSL